MKLLNTKYFAVLLAGKMAVSASVAYNLHSQSLIEKSTIKIGQTVKNSLEAKHDFVTFATVPEKKPDARTLSWHNAFAILNKNKKLKKTLPNDVKHF